MQISTAFVSALNRLSKLYRDVGCTRLWGIRTRHDENRSATSSIRLRLVLRAIEPAAQRLLSALSGQPFELSACPWVGLARGRLGLRRDLFAWEDNPGPVGTFLRVYPYFRRIPRNSLGPLISLPSFAHPNSGPQSIILALFLAS